MPVQRLLRLLPTDSFLAAAYGAAVEVPSETASGLEDGKLVWLHAAYEGEFKGYRFPMKLTKEFFASLIENIRRDPQFRAGEDGYGANPVVRMDYEHASAMPPTEGSIPEVGAPAPGWVCDAEMRAGKGGRVDFWCLCQLGPKLADQFKKLEQRFLSIDAPLKSKDPVTGQDRGPKLRALAVTNDPFLRDLEPNRIAASMSVWGKAQTVEELVAGLRQALELPDTATTDELKTNLDAVFVAYQNGVRPPGCPDGLGFVLDGVRRLLGLPLLTTPEQIMTAAGQALEAASGSPVSTPLQPAQPQENAAMTTPAATPDKLRQALVLLFGCVDHEEVIIAAATKASGASAILDEMMKMYGAKDPKDLAEKAGAARDAAGKAAEFGGKMAELLATLDGNAQTETSQETEQIAASLGFAKDDARGKSARSVIFTSGLAARRAALGLVVAADGKTLTLGAKDPAKFDAFRAEYPLPSGEQRAAALLTTPILAGAGGMQLGGTLTGLPAGGGAPGGGAAGGTLPPHIQEIAGYPGPNNIAKAIAMLSDKQPGFKLQPWSEQNRIAGTFVATGKAA